MHMPTARTARLLSLLLVLALCLPAVPAAAPQSSPAPTTTAAGGAQCLALQGRLSRQQSALQELQAQARALNAERALEQLRHAHQVQTLQARQSQLQYVTVIAVLSLLLLATAGFLLQQRKRQSLLRQLSEVDSLTGLSNRHAATAALNAMAAQRGPEGTRHVLFLIDIDHFKHVNDTHGHPVGDEVLQHAARLIRGGLRQHDRAGRLGGEEFAVLLDDVDADTALTLAERLRRSVEAAPAATAAGAVSLTISLGLALVSGGDPARVLGDADAALYRAKRGGRNRVCVAVRTPG